MRSRTRGFTLIELMITVGIIVILASIAIPSYRTFVMRSHRNSATGALLRVQSAQEKFYLQNNTYSANIAGVPPAGLGLEVVSQDGLYTIGFQGAPDNVSFTAIATAQGDQLNDTRCRTFTIDHNGVRAAFDSGGASQTAECWR